MVVKKLFLSVFISDFRLVQNIFIYSNLIEEIYLTVKNQVWFIWGKTSSLFYILFFSFSFLPMILKCLKDRVLTVFFSIFQKINLKRYYTRVDFYMIYFVLIYIFYGIIILSSVKNALLEPRSRSLFWTHLRI